LISFAFLRETEREISRETHVAILLSTRVHADCALIRKERSESEGECVERGWGSEMADVRHAKDRWRDSRERQPRERETAERETARERGRRRTERKTLTELFVSPSSQCGGKRGSLCIPTFTLVTVYAQRNVLVLLRSVLPCTFA
jgi:hypothetical protein